MKTAPSRTSDRRRESVTPEFEDMGLFKGELCRLQVEVTPSLTINERADIIVDGFIKTDAHIKIAFAGRRRLLFSPLSSRLKAIELKHIKAMKEEMGKDAVVDVPASDVRLPVLIEGAWRMRFELDADGFQKRINQFVAARWVFATESGETKTFGHTPSHLAPFDT